jgi:hypothetical protein
VAKVSALNWIALKPGVDLGFLPGLIHEGDVRPVAEQLNDRYRHGGGWRPTPGFTLNKATLALKYPEDPSMHPLAMSTLRDETLVFYPPAFLMILQGDGSFEVSRVD